MFAHTGVLFDNATLEDAPRIAQDNQQRVFQEVDRTLQNTESLLAGCARMTADPELPTSSTDFNPLITAAKRLAGPSWSSTIHCRAPVVATTYWSRISGKLVSEIRTDAV